MGFAKDSNGWYIPTPSASSKIYYVSDADGDDGTAKEWTAADGNYDTVIGSDPRNPLQEANVLPYKTVAAAYSAYSWGTTGTPDAGEPNWLLFKRGDTFAVTGRMSNSWPNYRYGLSGTERAIVTSYGASTTRPIIRSINGVTPFYQARFQKHFALIGIEFYCYTRDPADPGFDLANIAVEMHGIRIFDSGADISAYNHTNILVEDCKSSFYNKGILLAYSGSNNAGGSFDGLEIRRNVVHNCSGIGYYQESGCAGVKIEENVWYHNGWYGDRDTGGAWGSFGITSIYKHNIYFDNENPADSNNTGDRRTDFYVTGNTFMAAASHGVQIRAGGTVEYNLFIEEPIAINNGGGDGYATKTPNGMDSVVRYNVMVNAVDINTSLPRAVGIKNENCRLTEVAYNFAKDGGTGVNAAFMKNDGDNSYMNVHHNIAYNQPDGFLINGVPVGSVQEYNEYWDWPGGPSGTNVKSEGETYTDATRDVEAYDTYLGGTGTHANFIAECMLQSYQNWRTNYTAEVAGAWILAGFDIDSGGATPTPTSFRTRGRMRVRAKVV